MEQSTAEDAAPKGKHAADRGPWREHALLAGQKRVLELIATDAPIDETLAALVDFIEAQENDLRCGLLIVSDDGKHFRQSIGASLPDIFHQSIEGAAIAPPYLGSCVEAVHLGHPVVVADIAGDERYSKVWRQLMTGCGLEAAYSTPVRAADGRVLASFAMYRGKTGDPTPARPELLEIATHLAGIALERSQVRQALRASERHAHELLDALPVAVYETDAEGRVKYYNKTATDLAGREPALGSDQWCINWRLRWPDGRPMRHDQSPMAIAHREQRAIDGAEAAAERPDGTLVPFLAFPRPLRDEQGNFTGAVNTLVDITPRKRTEQNLRASEERLAAELEAARQLQTISTQLQDEDDVEALYRQIVKAAAAIMNSDAASLQMLVADGNNKLRLLASTGFHPDSAAFWEWVGAGSGSTCGAALASGRRTIVEDVETCEFMAGSPDLAECRRSQIRAVQSTPLVSRTGRVLGMISTHWRQPHRPGERDLRLLDVLARQAADLIERRRNTEALRAQTERLKTLNNLARTLASDLDLDHIIQTVVDSATALAGAQFGAFFYNTSSADGGEGFRLAAVAGAPRELFERFGTPRVTSMFGATFRGEPVIRSDDVRLDPRYGHNPPYHGIPPGHPLVASYLAVPVKLRSGETIGAMFFGHERPGVFTQDGEDVVAGLAAHAATALDNARLFEALQAELGHSRRNERAARQLAAIVESSDDAVVSKDLNGIIQTWNRGAERLFGYLAEEVIGKSILILIPPERDDEEPEILARIRRGESVDHYDTVRRRKDGTRIDISLTVSPIRDATGKIIGASKIARDISDRRAAEAHRELLLHELSHRVKNSLATVQSIAQQTLLRSSDPQMFQERFLARLAALAHTHDLLMRTNWHGVALRDLAAMELAPYGGADSARCSIGGPHVQLDAKSAVALGMALHELATNAAKYGALSAAAGRVELTWRIGDGEAGGKLLKITWKETKGPRVSEPVQRGFGSRLIEQGLAFELDATVKLTFRPAGVRCTIDLPLESIVNKEQP